MAGDDELEYDEEKYSESGVMTESVTDPLQRDADSQFLTWIECEDGDCTNKEGNPAEEAWVKLMSAIPIEGQLNNVSCASTGFPTPSQSEIQGLVEMIRPNEPDKFAIRTIMDHWWTFKQDFGVDDQSGVAGELKTALNALKDGWVGDDFDAFEEQVNIVINNCLTIADEIGDEGSGAIQILDQKWREIYALQGQGGGLPYPAPMYWIKDKGGLFSNPNIHVRVPFARNGCEVQEGCMFGDGADQGALEMGGFDSGVVDEAQQYYQAQVEYYMAEGAQYDPPTTRAQAEQWAQADADRELGDVAEVNEDNFEQRAEIANSDVVNRWNDAETAAGGFQPTATPAEPSTFGDSAGDLSDSGYSPPGGGSGGLNPGEMPTGSGPSGLEPMENPTPSGGLGGGGLGGGYDGGGIGGGGSGGGLDPDNPWDSNVPDPDDVGGGLASGGGGGLPGGGGGLPGGGGGLPGGGAGGGGLGAGAGGGAMGGMMGAGGGMGRGAGAGAGGKGSGMRGGAGMGKGGGGRAGMGGMMGGGGRGMGGAGENEDGKDTWLTEDDDVWGIGNEEEDPYA